MKNSFSEIFQHLRSKPAFGLSLKRVCLRSERRKQMLPALKLSTKCRQLESKTGNFRKKFPVLRRLNVKGGIPSPLHNPPMRVQTMPHGRRVVYSLSAGSRCFRRFLTVLRFSLLRFSQSTMAFLGQASAQVPQPTHRSSSSVQVLAARSTVSAPAGHLRAQMVQ